jgi:putative serine/threonine protein kinase
LTRSITITPEDFVNPVYGRILCYPRFDTVEVEDRIAELKSIGVNVVELTGPKTVENLPVLGKGCVSVVVLAHNALGRCALKIRRTDSDRSTMEHEAEMLRIANSVGAGPKLHAASKNFLLMDYVEGTLFPSWVNTLKGKGKKRSLQNAVLNILEICFKLDRVGLDHGELSRAPKHIIVTSKGKPILVDFETASMKRKPSNLTSTCQYLFIGSEVSKRVRKIVGEIEISFLIEALREYKQEMSEERFRRVLQKSGLGMMGSAGFS